jgi:hypothetical protein
MLLSSGQACGYPMKGSHAKYGSFAYSSAYGYSVPTGVFTLEQYALASQLGLSDDGGEFWKARRKSEYAALESRDDKPVLVSVWKPFTDVTVKTFLVPPEPETPNWHLRIHRIETGREVMTADGAFAIRNMSSNFGRNMTDYDAQKKNHEGTFPRLIGNYDLQVAEGWVSGKQGGFAVSDGAVGIKALEDEGNAGRMAFIVNADPNTNIVEGKTVIPTLQHTIKAGEAVWYISAIYAKPSGEGIAPGSYLDGWEKTPAIPSWLAAEGY